MVADCVGQVGASTPIYSCEDTFGAAEELYDFLDTEAGGEACPDVGAEAVTIHEAESMAFIQGIRGGGEEVAGSFANVDEGCGCGVADVGPESAGGEGFANGEGSAG